MKKNETEIDKWEKNFFSNLVVLYNMMFIICYFILGKIQLNLDPLKIIFFCTF